MTTHRITRAGLSPFSGARCLVLGVSAAVLAGLAVAPAAEATTSTNAFGAQRPVAVAQVARNNRYLLRIDDAALDVAALRRALSGAGAHLVAAQLALGIAVADVPSAALDAVAALPFVASMAADAEVHATSLGTDAAGQAGSLASVARISGATGVWARGFTGAGVDVALLDTGIAPSGGFADPAKVVVGPDLSFESQQPEVRSLDTYGHGTNMAGIIAGREGVKATGGVYAGDAANFYGMAPDARIVSVKLADHNGAVDVSQMIAGIDWVVANQKSNGLNIRVLNISYGTLSRNDAQSDPLAWAAESAWRAGVVVVASAGNEADQPGTVGLSSPAFNPWLLAVGATDTKGTPAYTDDTVPGFSQRGAGAGAGVGSVQRGPDLVAPGVGIVSLGVNGSKLDVDHPAAKIGTGLLRGSGTSQAAAVVSGSVALLLQQYPWMTPDDVKGHLTRTATKLTGISTAVQGAGELNLATALGTPALKSVQNLPVGNGNGTLEKSRGGNNVAMDGQRLTGERDVMGTVWNSTVMSASAATKTAWKAGGIFNGATWIGENGLAVDTSTWTGAWYENWSGRTWSGRTWSGRTWSGRTWSGRTWSGRTWSGTDWAGANWTGNGWSSATWTTPVEAPTWAGRVWTSAEWR